MDFYIVLTVFTVLQIVIGRIRSRATSREIEEALGARDYLIESLRSEMRDRQVDMQERCIAAGNAAAEAEAAAAAAKLKADSAEGCLQQNIDSKIQSAVAGFEGDFNINLGANGTIAVGETLLKLMTQGEPEGWKERLVDLHEDFQKLNLVVRDLKAAVEDQDMLIAGLKAAKDEQIAANRKMAKSIYVNTTAIKNHDELIGRLNTSKSEHEGLIKLANLRIGGIEAKVEKGKFGDVIVETRATAPTSLRAVGTQVKTLAKRMLSAENRLDEMHRRIGAMANAKEVSAPLPKASGAIERFRRERRGL